MKQLVHETEKLAISTVLLDSSLAMFDAILNLNKQNLPYETIVFPLVDGRPDFGSPIEIVNYSTEAEAKLGHQKMILKYDSK
jgi:hypothetical protein